MAEWKKIVPSGNKNGIGAIEKGFHKHEVFVSDQTSNLFAIDTQNGRVIYGYKGLAGSIASMAPSRARLVSTSLDRYARVHSTFPPPPEACQPQDDKGAVLEKVYMKSIPTCVVWDGDANEEDADNDLQIFLDFNAIYILIEVAKFPNLDVPGVPGSGRSWVLGTFAYIACWVL